MSGDGGMVPGQVRVTQLWRFMGQYLLGVVTSFGYGAIDKQYSLCEGSREMFWFGCMERGGGVL